MNAISVIHPYQWNGMLVFDDLDRGLIKEPFVAGADTNILQLTNNAQKCSMLFSNNEFPGSEHIWHKVAEGIGGGTDYEYKFKDGTIHPLWLCPALYKYFETAPDQIHFKLVIHED